MTSTVQDQVRVWRGGHRPPQQRMQADYGKQQRYDRAVEALTGEPYEPIEQHDRPEWARDFIEGAQTEIGGRLYLFIAYDRRGWVLLAPLDDAPER